MASEKVPVKEVRNLPKPVRSMHVCRHAEHLVQLLEGLALGFGEEEQDEPPTNDVPGCVPAEGALGRECCEEGWPGDGEDEVEEPGCCSGEGHAVCADVQWVGFRGVGEWNGA